MPIKVEFGGPELTGHVQRQPSAPLRTEPGAVRMGVIGDFRGQGPRGPVESGRALAGRRCHRIDRDNLDVVLAQVGAELALTLPGVEPTPIVLTFGELDDFHPDRILGRAEVFAALRATRHRLEDPATFAEVAAEIGLTPRPAVPSTPAPPPVEPVPAAALLDLIRQQSPQPAPPAPTVSAPTGAWGAFLEQITAPHIQRADPLQAELIAGVDAAMAQLLRAILHHPEFQALESLWRAVHLLTQRLETGPDRSLELIALSRAELEADLVSTTPLDSTAAYKLLVEPSVGTPGGRPWTFLVVDATFGPSPRDVALLWRLGQIARLAGAPLLAAASPRFVGCDVLASSSDPDDWSPPESAEGWPGLRRSAEAPYLGLALPRWLLRLPYGPETKPIETVSFAEFLEAAAHESYLWGNPAIAVALLLGRSFDAAGHFDPTQFDPELTDLPLALERTEDGETQAKPCAEVLLGARAADRIGDTGLMPLLSVRDRGAARLARLASIADPAAPLALG
jgi:type VI secretion system ImpC/EvpB family protein